MGEARQRVHLVHELGELAGAEELLDGRDDRPDVDERLRRDRLDVLGGHALPHDALHAGQADAHLVLDQLADRADAPVREVVLIVEAVARLLLGEVEQVAARGEHLAAATARPGRDRGSRGGRWSRPYSSCELRDLGAELAVQLVATDARQVVAAASRRRRCGSSPSPTRRWAARPGGRACRSRRGLRRASGARCRSFSHWPSRKSKWRTKRSRKPGRVLLVVAEGAQQHEDRQAALASDAGAGGDVLAGLLLDVELDPLAAVGVDRARHPAGASRGCGGGTAHPAGR